MFCGDERGVVGRGLMWGVGRELRDMGLAGGWGAGGQNHRTVGQKKGRTGYLAEILGLLRACMVWQVIGEHLGVIGLLGVLGRGSQVGFRCDSSVPLPPPSRP